MTLANRMIRLEVPEAFAARIETLAARAGYHVPQIYAEQLLQGAVMLLERPEGDALRAIMTKEKSLPEGDAP
jgi:aminoglycoside/choline kinase family phosphotransferase